MSEYNVFECYYIYSIFFLCVCSGSTGSQHIDNSQDGAGVGKDVKLELDYQAVPLRESVIHSPPNHMPVSSIPPHN